MSLSPADESTPGVKEAVAKIPPRGLFDGFEGYRTPTEDDYRDVLTGGLVVPDTNVLLNLYRYHEGTQADFFKVLESLGDRLWVPNQVLVEFWRNRESALRDPQETVAQTVLALDELRDNAINALRKWVNRLALPPHRLTTLQPPLEQAFGSAVTEIRASLDSTAGVTGPDTNGDAVLIRLESVLEGRVGARPSAAERAAAIAEGQRRVAARQPPGYLDADKNKLLGTEGASGDYLVWSQVLEEAGRRQCDVLIVTADVKEDWWRKVQGETRGPRVELAEELRDRVGKRLFMLRPESLLLHALSVLAVEVDEGTVIDIERVDRSPIDAADAGWSAEGVATLLNRLAKESPVQYNVILTAAAQGGFVSRTRVFEIGDYESSRTLRQFTTPAKRIAESLREDGTVPRNAVDPLETIYDSASISLMQASGFQIPDELIPLVQSYVDSKPAQPSA